MGDVSSEPSMEEILSSIKRIIAEDGDTSAATARTRAAAKRKPIQIEPEPEPEEVLELTDAFAEEEDEEEEARVEQPEPQPVTIAQVAPPKPVPQPLTAELISSRAALASRQSLESLSSLIVKPEAGDNTLEGLVRDMLRPMLKEWLDANLPEVVERMVAREIKRITGKDA
jgi:uncharacterized protein